MASCLEEDLTCVVCLEIYQDPQLLSCGHSLCRRCINHHHHTYVFTNGVQTCPMCHKAILREPVSNLALRNTCETYKREKEREKERKEQEEDVGIKCVLHGEKIMFFCRNDEQAICSRCRKQNHRSHRVQPLTHTVHQRKDQIRAALRPAEKVLESLKDGSALEQKVTKYIECQAKQTEKQIKEEFEKLHQFLREEEESRTAALREEEKEKKKTLEGWIEQEQHSLSDRVLEVEEGMENDDVTFLSNYQNIMTRAQLRSSGSQMNPESLINVARHVGNLRFRVWEKMKDLCPYYPVILDPNSSDVSVSGDLTCVSNSVHRFYSPNPLQRKDHHLVLGSEAQNANFNCWDVEVGDSKHWTIGVCHRLATERNHTQPFRPQNGFWGLSRYGDFCSVLGSAEPLSRIKKPLKTVRVKLNQNCDFNNWNLHWILRFSDADNDSEISRVPVIAFCRDLFPFLVSEEKNVPLRIVSVNVNMTLENKFNFLERHMDMIPIYLIGLVLILFAILVQAVIKIH